MNVFTGLSSVQGYGSLIDEHYGAITDTHPLYGLDGCQLARNIYHQLRLSSVVVSMGKLVTPVTPSMARPQLCVALRRSTTQYRYFGAVLPVDTVTIAGPGNRAPSTGWVYAQLLNSKGAPFGVDLALPSSSAMSFDFAASHEEGAGVVITSPNGTLMARRPELRGHLAPTYQLDTAFQQAVSSPAWRLRMTSGTLAYFRATTIRPSAWVASHTSSSRVTKIRDASWGDSWVTAVGARPTTIKRSMEWIPGWRATAVNNKTGESEALHVVRTGLIQQVAVPAGDRISPVRTTCSASLSPVLLLTAVARQPRDPLHQAFDRPSAAPGAVARESPPRGVSNLDDAPKQ